MFNWYRIAPTRPWKSST